jgi:polysaccharide chain length determinant protein (PEP-CTERM system associated)
VQVRVPNDQLLNVLVRELFLRRRAVLVSFLAINLLGAVVGLLWPKTYTSSTTIFVDETNIIQSLMQGAAVPTAIADRSRIAREVIFGRKVMTQLVEGLGLAGTETTEQQKAQVIENVKGRISVQAAGRGLIRIEYSDSDPERAYDATKLIGKLFIDESHQNKLAESTAAYDFINQQVSDYHEKLRAAEQQLKEVRSSIIEAGNGGSDTDVVGRMNQIRARLDQATQDLREAQIRKQSLQRQLSGETETALVLSREGQYRARISEMQTQLASLRLSYHDTHPDIVRLRHQIEDLQDAVKSEQSRRSETTGRQAGGELDPVQEGVIHNPLYQQLRRELSQTQTQIDLLTVRIAELNDQMKAELRRGRDVRGSEAQLAEVSRDYQVNNTIYQDLLRRRESALLSMNLDRERQGLQFKTQDEAAVPASPSGVRFLYVMTGAFLLSVLLPGGALFALINLDPRIRIPSTMTDAMKVPVLAVVPYLWSTGEVEALKQEVRTSLLLAVGAGILICIVVVLRISNALS